MENCNSLLSIHTGTGTTQNDRVRPALQTSFFLVDERKEQDFIVFVQKLSKYVNYYNEFDEVEGDWTSFYENETTSILILIANWNIQLLQNQYEILKNEIALNANFLDQQELLLDYFKQIKDEFEILVTKIGSVDDEISVKENLLSTSYAITEKLTFIQDQINSSSDIIGLMKNYVFVKNVQQLFGLLLSWKDFTNSTIDYQLNSYDKHTPHYTLFLSFLKLLRVAQDKLNEFTKNHLNFYYKDVLHIENQSAQPDYVHLVVEPYDTNPFLIPKNTIFPADKNSLGQKKFYSSTADQTINGIQLDSFLSTHFKNNEYYKSDLLPLNATNEGFNVFVDNAQLFKEGIMIASPNLYLQSGERTINLRFNNQTYLAKDFNFYLTGEEKVIEVFPDENFKEDKKLENQFISLLIPSTEKKIVPFNAKLHPELLIQTSFPVLKIVPKRIGILKSIHTIELNISVQNFKSFVLDSDFGKIDAEKAFFPFGEFPKKGNGIIVSSNEFFMKKNATATFVLVPEEGKSNDHISKLTSAYILTKGKYVSVKKATEIINSFPLKNYNFEEIVSENVVSNGKIRIELSNDSYAGEKFLQAFINASAKTATAAETAKYNTTFLEKPRAKSFEFHYSVNETIKLSGKTTENNPIELYHSLPFGYKKIARREFFFSRNNSLEGAIYLGFKNVLPKDGLNLLLQLEEGTANPLLPPATVRWHYLHQNNWTSLEPEAIGDETRFLTQSGLVSITVPAFSTTTNTVLEASNFWLRISVSNIQAVCKFIGVHTQALKAVLTDYEGSGVVFVESTSKEKITKTYDSFDKIKKITQPYSSFGGKVKEKDEFLYMRSSERLRHKNRAITSWDYERIILQEFPDVFRVKTLNHYRYDTKISNVSAGYITLIPIARSSSTDIVNWKPFLSLNKMILIKEHLQKIASPHARINVKPPRLEKVEINFMVKFHIVEGMDTRLYTKQLKETINQYLSPWAYENTEVNFANEIEFSSIIQLIDNQSFVDYITDFKVTQYVLNENFQVVGNPIQNLNKITPQTDFTLFVPNETHHIQEI